VKSVHAVDAQPANRDIEVGKIEMAAGARFLSPRARRIIFRLACLWCMQTENRTGSMALFSYRVLIATGIVAIAVLAWRLAGVFIVIFGGILLAAALRALTNFTIRYTHLPNRWALAVVVLALVALLGLGGWLIGEQVAVQLQELFKILPDAIERTRGWLERSKIGAALLEYGQTAADSGTGTLASVAKFATGTFGVFADMLLVVFLGLYLAAEPDLYRNGAIRLVPPQGRDRARLALDASGAALRGWLMGQLSAMFAVGLLTFLALKLLHMPLSLSLSLIAGLLEFIPFIGPILSAVPAVLVAFTVSPAEALYVLLAYLIIHQMEGHVILPIVQKWAVALPPALGISSILMFGWLFGIPGVLFAVPLIVVVIALVKTLYIEGALEAKPTVRRV
jgi:predicted PurR-regulated permease PerM